MATRPNPLPVLTSGIKSVEELSEGHPVYKITLRSRSESDSVLVVKGELKRTFTDTDAATSIVWGSKIMKNVTSRREELRAKPLTPPEFQELHRAIQQYCDPNSDARTAIQQKNLVWVKMPFVDDLKAGEYRSRTAKDLNVLIKIKRLVPFLLDPGTWYQLGVVTAVDLFIGNNDRFVMKWKSDIRHSEGRRGDLTNPGNILFLERVETALVLGLDTFDSNNTFSNLNAPLTDALELRKLNILKPEVGKVRLEFACGCLRGVGENIHTFLKDLKEDLEGSFKVKRRPLSYDEIQIKIDDLPGWFEKDEFTSAFARGIEHGAGQLTFYLEKKVRKSKERTAAAQALTLPRAAFLLQGTLPPFPPTIQSPARRAASIDPMRALRTE